MVNRCHSKTLLYAGNSEYLTLVDFGSNSGHTKNVMSADNQQERLLYIEESPETIRIASRKRKDIVRTVWRHAE